MATIIFVLMGPFTPQAQLLFDQKIDLTTADQASLEAIPGIGPTLAERIVTHVQKEGDVISPEEFLHIRGVGPKTVERLLPFIELQKRKKSLK